MQKLWSTAAVEERDRLAYWAEAVCDTFVQLDCTVPRDSGTFSGSIAFDQLAALGFSEVKSSPQTVRRTPAKIAAATEDFFLVSIQTAGRGCIMQDGRVATLAPGDFALYDSTRPYQLVFEEDFRQFVVQMPGALLRSRLRGIDALTARRVCGDRGAGHLVISMIQALARDLGTLEPGSVAAVAESLENILVAGFCALPGTGPAEASTSSALLRDQVKEYVRTRLRDPGLSVHGIAAHLRVSLSTVHRAFADSPCSLTAWIWGQRLEGARRDLGDPALARRSISEIAFGWGFSDAAHFSRSFRGRFGCSARELRVSLVRSGMAR